MITTAQDAVSGLKKCLSKMEFSTMLKQHIINMGIATKITQEKYQSIMLVLNDLGIADFYLMPSLVLSILPAGRETPREHGFPGVFIGRFTRDVSLRVLDEELTYAIEETCFTPEAPVLKKDPNNENYGNHFNEGETFHPPARIAVESVVTIDGAELTLAEHARRRGAHTTVRKKVAGWAATGFSINKTEGLRRGGIVPRSVVSSSREL